MPFETFQGQPHDRVVRPWRSELGRERLSLAFFCAILLMAVMYPRDLQPSNVAVLIMRFPSDSVAAIVSISSSQWISDRFPVIPTGSGRISTLQ